MIAQLKKGIKDTIGFANYFRLIDFKNSLFATAESKRKKEYFARMKEFYAPLIKPNDIYFDIGANMGNRIEVFLALGAKVVAVEPQDKCCSYLQKKFGNKIAIVKKGCGAKVESKDFFVADESTISSFSEKWISAVKENRFKEHEWKKESTIEMTTLDLLIKEYGKPQVIKIDVEGYEPEVLSGLSASIPHISFEYTEPELHDQTVACLNSLHKINQNVRFNYAVGETMKFASAEYQRYDEFKSFADSPKFQQTGFGDIYAQNID